MLFNVLAVNQDDLVKNLSFHMDRAGHWRLAPAYDFTFARGHGFTSQHQMRVQDEQSGIALADLLEVGRNFSINDPAASVERMRGASALWKASPRRHACRRRTWRGRARDWIGERSN